MWVLQKKGSVSWNVHIRHKTPDTSELHREMQQRDKEATELEEVVGAASQAAMR